jgi:hypothetical protein
MQPNQATVQLLSFRQIGDLFPHEIEAVQVGMATKDPVSFRNLSSRPEVRQALFGTLEKRIGKLKDLQRKLLFRLKSD